MNGFAFFRSGWLENYWRLNIWRNRLSSELPNCSRHVHEFGIIAEEFFKLPILRLWSPQKLIIIKVLRSPDSSLWVWVNPSDGRKASVSLAWGVPWGKLVMKSIKMSSQTAVGGVIGCSNPSGAFGTYLDCWHILHVEQNPIRHFLYHTDKRLR